MNRLISQETVSGKGGRDIFLFRLRNAFGSYVEITNYGATLISFVVSGKSGRPENIILSYVDVEEYFTDKAYLGSTVGRFANRISKAQFALDGTIYSLDKNDGNNSNHGGFNGFHSKIFDSEIAGNRLVLSYKSPDGEGGFPGNLAFSVTCSFADDHTLLMEYQAISDKETLFNPTNHAYFNLSGKDGNILDHELKIFAGHYLETDDEFIPTGKILPVNNTAFDFRDYRRLSEHMLLKKEILKGYNTYFISHSGKKLKRLAVLRDPSSGRTLHLFSTMPGVQVYTGDYLSGKHRPFSGIALEAQFYPDAPNHPGFKNCVLKPFKEVKHLIVFKPGVFSPARKHVRQAKSDSYIAFTHCLPDTAI